MTKQLKPFSFWNSKPSKPSKLVKIKPGKPNLFFQPKFIQPVNLKLYPQRTKQEIRLIDKNPFGDKDKDKVVNFFDCKPLNKSKQDVMLYHGTTQAAAKQIRKEGLKVGHGINSVLYLTPHEAIARKYAVGGPVFKVRLSDATAKKHGIPLKNQPNQVTISEHISVKKLKELKSNKSYPVRSKQETKLIDKNPFGDADGDNVPNIFDCKPLNRNLQGWKYKTKEEYMAAKKKRQETPEAIAKAKAKSQTPEYKAHRKAYKQTYYKARKYFDTTEGRKDVLKKNLLLSDVNVDLEKIKNIKKKPFSVSLIETNYVENEPRLTVIKRTKQEIREDKLAYNRVARQQTPKNKTPPLISPSEDALKLSQSQIEEFRKQERLDINKINREKTLSRLKDIEETPRRIQYIIPPIDDDLQKAIDIKEKNLKDLKDVFDKIPNPKRGGAPSKKETSAEKQDKKEYERELQKKFQDDVELATTEDLNENDSATIEETENKEDRETPDDTSHSEEDNSHDKTT
jgi:hypothetical protein